MASRLSVDVSVTDTALFDDLLEVLRYAHDHADQDVKDEIKKRINISRIKQAGIKFLIGASSLEKAEQVALEHGLRRSQWRRAHAGYPKAHLKDGLGIVSEEQLLGEFTSIERELLTSRR